MGVGVVANEVVVDTTEGEAEKNDTLVIVEMMVPPLVLLLVGPIVALIKTNRLYIVWTLEFTGEEAKSNSAN